MTWTGHPRTTTSAHRKRRQRIFDRDGHRCLINGPRCNGRAEHRDHIDNTLPPPRYDAEGNLQASCGPCNMWKASREGNAAQAARRARLRLPAEPHPGG